MSFGKHNRLGSLLLWLLLIGSGVVRAQTSPLSDLDALRYIASHPDLIEAYGVSAEQGRSHYTKWGFNEGRKITFEPLYYTASHPDLIEAFGLDETKSVTHYIRWGYKERRQTTFTELTSLRYIASHPDLIEALGADAGKGVRHYIQWGYKEGRPITFDPLRYTASHFDLIDAFGVDERKATTHYIQWGYKEKRQVTFRPIDALNYIASSFDLIAAFGADVAAGTRHYVQWGFKEGRKIVFDALAYIASHFDLISAFGADAVAGATHYINTGFREGRRVTFDALGYLAAHFDLRAAFGTDTAAATQHYINWGFKEGRQYSFTVTVRTSSGGVVSKSRAYVAAGERETFLFTPATGYYLASVTGCNGILSQNTYTTGAISRACDVSAEFKVFFGDISGTVRAFDTSRPAFVTLVSADDDSVLRTFELAGSGDFRFTDLDARKDYYVKFEQSGYEANSARIIPSDSGFVDALFSFVGLQGEAADNPGSVPVNVGQSVSFDGRAIKGLIDGEFNYRWEADNTVSGVESITYVPNPTRVESLGKVIIPANTESATRLADRYGIVLLNPDSTRSSDEIFWTEEYTDRLYEVLAEMPFAVIAGESTTKWPGITRIRLSKREISDDVSKSTDKFVGSEILIATAAFENATPALARIDGRRGIFYSSRLFRVALRIASENGTNADVLKEVFRSRFGLQVASKDSEGMIIRPGYCEQKPEYRRDCEATEWRALSPEEFLSLAAIYEEFPQPLKDLSSPTQQYPLVAAMRRRVGSISPTVPTAAALAHLQQGFMEFLDPTFFNRGDRQTTYRISAHEKAHFVYQNLDSKTRLDWARLSGWWRNPVVPGSTNSVSGDCDKWRFNPNAWIPPNTTDLDLQNGGSSARVVGHDGQQLDRESLRNGWGYCSGGTDFVTAYAATNVDEDFSDSFGFFMTNPDKLRAVAPKKYDFLRDRIMQGTAYVSRIRSDLTFQVYNLYPDYSYPGKIKALTVKVVGKPAENKTVTIRLELFTEACSNDSSCPRDLVDGYATLRSREVISDKGGFSSGAVILNPGFGQISRGVLESTFTVPATAPAGWYQVDELVLRNRVGDLRKYKQQSEDFGFSLYINNPNEDITPPEYVRNSLTIRLLDKADPLASPSLSDDTRQIYYSFRVKENRPGFNYCEATYVYEPSDSSQRIRPLNVKAIVTPLSGVQSDGANYVCEGLINMSSFKRSGIYAITRVAMIDGPGAGAGGLLGDYSFSFRGVDPAVERSPEVVFDSKRSDTISPELDIRRCVTADPAERCLRVTALPTVPAAPNGETEVMVYYWARENQTVETASGLGSTVFYLRDPTGKTFAYLGDSSTENLSGSGVPGYSPVTPELSSNVLIKAGDGRLFPVWSKEKFECPSSALKPCDATTWVQYRAKVLLPRGSAPGTWGLYQFSVSDKVWSERIYNFTETFRFTPSRSSCPTGKKCAQSVATTPFTFEVSGAADQKSSVTATAQVSNSDASAINILLKESLTHQSRVIADRFRAVEEWFTRSHDYGRGVRGGNTSAVAVSSAQDHLTGSLYRLERAISSDGIKQSWRLDYLGRSGTVFGAKNLPDTAEVSWRRSGRVGEQLATTGWARVCSDRVWTVQDGYQLLFHVGDRALADLRPGQLVVNSTAEATVITDVRCAFGGAVWIEGYAFGISGNEPPLRTSSVPAARFGFALDRYGVVTKREVSSAPFDVVGLCTVPTSEQQMFCSDTKKVLLW